MTRSFIAALCVAACVTSVAPAQESETPAEGLMKTRLRTLEKEVQELRRRLDDEGPRPQAAPAKTEEGAKQLGFQLNIRFEYFELDHSREGDVFAPGADENDGFGAGVGLRLPLWLELFPKLDLIGFLDITYRQVDDAPNSRAPITGAKNTTSYANILAGPMLRYTVAERFRPFIFGGFNLQVQTPPTDGITYLDAGFCLGAGIDVLVHEKISVGLDIKANFIGAGDQEDSDYKAVGAYIGFNF